MGVVKIQVSNVRSFTLKWLAFCLVVIMCLAAFILPGNAKRDFGLTPAQQSDYELVVLEVRQCIYCQLFRRDVVPTYESTRHAKSIPMRFVDLDFGSTDGLRLSGPVDTVPTVLLLRNHQEIGRLTGHIGPETFLHAFKQLLSEAP